MNENILPKLKKVLLVACISAFTLVSSGSIFAADRDNSQARLARILKTKGTGWQIKSNGGLLYINPQDKRYWFALSGIIRLDQTQFGGRARDIRADYPSGGHMRRVEVDLTGGIGQDWNYTLGIEFANGRRAGFSDSWVSYSGIADNFEVFVGRHSANWFGLENSTSTSWYPFLERSVMANIFYPGDGLGVLVDYWLPDAGFTFLALQPDQGNKIITRDGQRVNNDRWLGLTRATFAPCHEKGNVWHFGISGVYRQNDSGFNGFLNEFSMSTRPNARARDTAQLVATGRLDVNRSYMGNVEFARQYGPLIVQAEYAQGLYKRRNAPLGSIQVRGWDVQAQYMLTGEIHNYDVRDGFFGGIDVKSPYGAWEIAARYDYVNLNDKDVNGGKEHDVTLGLSWYVNNNVRVSANYIHAQLMPNPLETTLRFANKRTLNIFAARIQIKFK